MYWSSSPSISSSQLSCCSSGGPYAASIAPSSSSPSSLSAGAATDELASCAATAAAAAAVAGAAAAAADGTGELDALLAEINAETFVDVTRASASHNIPTSHQHQQHPVGPHRKTFCPALSIVIKGKQCQQRNCLRTSLLLLLYQFCRTICPIEIINK